MTDPAPPETTEVKSTPIFGSSTAFGGGGGFGGFGGGGFAAFTANSSQSTAKVTEEEAGEAGGEDEAPEEECQAEFKPIVQLEEVETNTGEEDEITLLELKSKLYRFDTSNNEWKERGIGQTKLLQHKVNRKVRLLMRQDKTLKIRANHIVMPNLKLQEHLGSDKAWVWSTVDFAGEEQKVELFCIRFGSVEKAQEFKVKFEEAQAINADLIKQPIVVEEDESEKQAEEVAQALEKVSVEEESK